MPLCGCYGSALQRPYRCPNQPRYQKQPPDSVQPCKGSSAFLHRNKAKTRAKDWMTKAVRPEERCWEPLLSSSLVIPQSRGEEPSHVRAEKTDRLGDRGHGSHGATATCGPQKCPRLAFEQRQLLQHVELRKRSIHLRSNELGPSLPKSVQMDARP